jgi:hypothetical protein
VEHGALDSCFGETTLPIKDPHRLQLALVETGGDQQFLPWENGPVPQDLEILMKIENRISLVEEILNARKLEMGNDYPGYKNHVYRMIHFCFALHDFKREEREKIIIAGCFHDLGIWIQNTFDYLLPSIALAKEYVTHNGLDHWFAEIELMIDMHHKLTPYRDERYPLVEVFRKGDLVDFSLGIVKCGLPKSFIKGVKERFPNAGFHKRLVQLELGWVSKHPSNPLPILKW